MTAKTSTRHSQIANKIISDIRSKRFSVGELLPSEPVLATHYGVSRSTLRAALATLKDLGIVDRKQGAGTMVCAEAAAPVYVHSMLASGDLMQFAGPSTRRVEEVEELVADELLAPKLDNRPGRRWIRIGQTRYISASDSPVCWTDVYLPEKYKDVTEIIPEHSELIYTLLERNYDVTIAEILQSIRPIEIPSHLKHRFDPAAGTKALELTRRYRSSSGDCELVSISVLPEKTYSYDITLTRKA